MKIKNLTAALLVITAILTKNLAFGCKTKSNSNDKVNSHRLYRTRTLHLTPDEERGPLNIFLPFGSFIRKLSPLFAPGIQRVMTC